MSFGANPKNTYNLRSKSTTANSAAAVTGASSARITSSTETSGCKQQQQSSNKATVKQQQVTANSTPVSHSELVFKSETKSELKVSVSVAENSFFESPQPSAYLNVYNVKSQSSPVELKIKRISSSPSLLEQFSVNLQLKSEGGDIEKFGESLFHEQSVFSESSPVSSSVLSAASLSSSGSSSSISSEGALSDPSLEMATNTLMPAVFNGLHTEYAEAWSKDVENWYAYKKLDDAGRIGLM